MRTLNFNLNLCFALLTAALLTGTATAQTSNTSVTLKDAFKDRFIIGAAINRTIATGASVRANNVNRTQEQVDGDIALTIKHFNQVSPENDLKWQLIHPTEGAEGYNWAPADAFVEFGQRNQMYLVGHTLVWHSQTPNWVFAGDVPPPTEAEQPARRAGRGRRGRGFSGPRASREQLLERVHDHIHAVVGRYKGKVRAWDVVNEALADGDGDEVLRNSLWLQIIGPDFIAKAFEYAHEADPNAILRYNDYGLENPAKRRRLITLIKQLQEQGVPVHAIGTQAHLNVSNATFERMDEALTEMETLGLPIHVTELDINSAQGGQRNTGADIANNAAATQGGLVSEADERLADAYRGTFRAFLKHQEHVKVVTFWGVNDAVSWRASGRPLLFDGDNQPKPAFAAVIDEAQKAGAARPASAAKTIRIKAGQSTPFTDSDGNVWLADQGFTGGLTIDRDPAMRIAATKDAGLYLTERYSMESFSHKLPNGKYLVKLHFAETFEGISGPGERVFSFNVQGKEFKDFDVWVKANGPNRAYIETVPVEITDGELRITFTHQIENPEINAIEIIPQTGNAQAQPAERQPAPTESAEADAGPRGERRGRGGRGGRGGFGGPIELGPDDKAAFADPPDGFRDRRDQVARGEIKAVQYDSKSLGTRRQFRIYTPPGYSTDRKYPVLYLLHGIGGDDMEWIRTCRADIVLDNALADGKIQPMIVVFPNGNSSVTADAANAPRGEGGEGRRGGGGRRGGRGGGWPTWGAPFEIDLLKDIIPFVEANYSVHADREHRALAGLSMGGGQTLNIAPRNVDTFAYVGGFSSAPNTNPAAEVVTDPESLKKLKLLYLSCGNKDGLIRISQGVHSALKEKDVPHVWHVDSNGHDGTHWANNLYLFGERIFK